MSEIRHRTILSLRSGFLGISDHCIAAGLLFRERENERHQRLPPLDHWSAIPHHAASVKRMIVVQIRVSNFEHACGRKFAPIFR